MHTPLVAVIETVSAKIDMGVELVVEGVESVETENGTATVDLGEMVDVTRLAGLPVATVTFSKIDVVTDETAIELSETETTTFSPRIDEGAVQHRRLRNANPLQILPMSFPSWSANDA